MPDRKLPDPFDLDIADVDGCFPSVRVGQPPVEPPQSDLVRQFQQDYVEVAGVQPLVLGPVPENFQMPTIGFDAEPLCPMSFALLVDDEPGASSKVTIGAYGGPNPTVTVHVKGIPMNTMPNSATTEVDDAPLQRFKVAEDGAIVVVTGGRDVAWRPAHTDVLITILVLYSPIAALWHGGAIGIDEGAGLCARELGVPVRVFLPEPSLLPEQIRYELVKRNDTMMTEVAEAMRLENRRAIVVALPGGDGTDNAARAAQRRSIEVVDLRSAPYLRNP